MMLEQWMRVFRDGMAWYCFCSSRLPFALRRLPQPLKNCYDNGKQYLTTHDIDVFVRATITEYKEAVGSSHPSLLPHNQFVCLNSKRTVCALENWCRIWDVLLGSFIHYMSGSQFALSVTSALAVENTCNSTSHLSTINEIKFRSMFLLC